VYVYTRSSLSYFQTFQTLCLGHPQQKPEGAAIDEEIAKILVAIYHMQAGGGCMHMRQNGSNDPMVE
jgi:hypothetical protein